ncbi:hypothetical protein MKW92_016933 [Papaver armeniacum]|nr:hypothetical protein MKW92_016933 [Papaver armeniacum]
MEEQLVLMQSESSNAQTEDLLLNTMGKLAIDETTTFKKKPGIIIAVKCIIGSDKPGYVVNIDPAIMTLPYGANIDIRDTVKHKEVMNWYNLVVSVIEKRADQLDYVLADTPVTFMSNMLYAYSILYKTRLPSVLAFNKTDVAQHEFTLEVIYKQLLEFFVNTYLVLVSGKISTRDGKRSNDDIEDEDDFGTITDDEDIGDDDYEEVGNFNF